MSKSYTFHKIFLCGIRNAKARNKFAYFQISKIVFAFRNNIHERLQTELELKSFIS